MAIWALLNAMANGRAPARDVGPGCWFFLPSVDVTVVLGMFALLGWRGIRVPAMVGWLLAGLLIAVRIFRLGDGLIRLNYYRPINLYLDVPLVPELARLLVSTVAWPKLLLGAAALLLAVGVVVALTAAAMGFAQRALTTQATPRWILLGGVMVCLALTPLWRSYDQLHIGLFGQSVLPSLVEQVRFGLAAGELRRRKSAEIAATQEKLRVPSATLSSLGGADVFVFFVESYGSTVFRQPAFAAALAPTLNTFAAELGRHDLFVATGLLDSPTYGGGSWLAHATFASGVTIKNGLEFAVLRQTTPPPRTLASFFRDAGYRTILVQPGTTRPWPEGEVSGFMRKYYAADFHYRGPPFGWATMPDQFVVDFLHRQEVAPADRPLFIEYALVSSHAPWNAQSPLLSDWSRLGDGSVFHTVKPLVFPVTWQNLEAGGPAYIRSLIYDFQALQQYIARLADRRALFVILGDHQPPGNVSKDDPSPAVPVHLISRDRQLLDRFAADGYVAGMNPPATGETAGMDTFLPMFLARVRGGEK
ncbi:MAG TPA: sulfatase-like hydrolase/transferase [Polyangia bacterium]|nr:sulfatase-like hydrolase/transferase [Polyangia bacterium]